MLKKKSKIGRIIGLICVCLVTTVLVAIAANTIQYRIAYNGISNELNKELDILFENYKRLLPLKAETEEYNNQIYKSFAQLASEILTREGEEVLSNETLVSLCTQLSANNIAVITADGRILYQAYPMPVDFRRDRFNQLRAAARTGQGTDGFSVRINDEKTLYYAYPLGEDKIVVLTVPSKVLDEANEEAFGWSNLLANAKVGIDGFSYVYDSATYEVIWAEDERLIGQSHLGFITTANPWELTDESAITLNILGTEYFAVNKYYAVDESEKGISLATCIPKREISNLVTTPVILLTLVFGLGAGILIVFCMIQTTDELINSVRRLRKKLVPVAIVIAVFIILATYYLQTLSSLSIGMMKNETNVSNIESTIQKYQVTEEKIIERNSFCTARIAELAAYMVTRFPDMKSTEGLKKLAQIAGCEEIRIYDTKGRSIESSGGQDAYELSDDPTVQSYEFRRLLRGVDYYCQPIMPNEQGDIRQYAGKALRDVNGNNIGLIQVSVIPVQVTNAQENYSYKSALSSFAAADGTFAWATDKDRMIVWHPSERLIGKNALEYGLTEANFKDDFNGFQTINGLQCFGSCKEDDERYIFVSTPQSDVYKDRARDILVNTAVILVMLTLLVLIIPIIVPKASEEEIAEKAEAQKAQERKSLKYYITEQWTTSNSGKKIASLLRVVFITQAFAISLIYLTRNVFLNEGSIVKYVFDGRWEKGMNVFAFTACLSLVSVITVAVMLLKRMLTFLSKALNSRGETVCRLIGNFVSVFSVFVGLYFCLSYFGVDTSTLLTSAGIMSVVIGLGANKLISDILAGLTIVFDGSIKVGDTIKAGGDEGIVREIGIRSTKLVDAENKLHILSNTSLGGIVNSSVPDFKVRVLMNVAFDESLDKIVQMLDNERADLKNRYPQIVDGPFVDGVETLSNSNYQIRFSLFCDGKYADWMRRIFQDELRKMFIKYEIRR